MIDKKNNEWLQEYQNFIQSEEKVPTEVSTTVYNKIQSLLNPSSLVVFAKIFAIQLGVGYLSLSVCHQFGMDPFNTETSLVEWMMKVGGHQFCMIGCGILFIGAGILAAGAFLTIEEVNALKRTKYLQIAVLGLTSLAVFGLLGAEIALGIAGLWLAGGFVGGIAATETVFRLKRI